MMPVAGDKVLVHFPRSEVVMTGNVIEILDVKIGMFDTILVEFKSYLNKSSSFIKRVSEHQILRIDK